MNHEIDRQIELRSRREAIEASLRNGSAAVLVNNKAMAVQVADRIAAEHVSLADRGRPGCRGDGAGYPQR